MPRRLTDRVAIVTGAGSIAPGWGNGKAISVLFAREGAKVFAADINTEAAQETVDIIRSEGGVAIAHKTDVSNANEVETLVSCCVEAFGRVDIFHHNVGIVTLGGPVELSEADWKRTISVNLSSCFYACKYALPIMLRQERGVIQATGSVAGIRYTGFPYVAYNVTKAGLMQLMQSVALQYAAKGIRANCILPGLMDTPLIYQGLPGVYSSEGAQKMVEIRKKQCPTGNMGDAWDVAYAALFLASDEAKYITGQNLVVDGGLTCKYA
jgi:NAD(P)-dependent dehydrogenase (short-subunit alcohol dehydrogenase family)